MKVLILITQNTHIVSTCSLGKNVLLEPEVRGEWLIQVNKQEEQLSKNDTSNLEAGGLQQQNTTKGSPNSFKRRLEKCYLI